MPRSRTSADHADHDLAAPGLDQRARRGEWVEPGVEPEREPTAEDEGSEIARALAAALTGARASATTALDIARALPRPVKIVTAGVVGFVALAVLRRATRRRRPSSAGGRAVRELGREIVGRAALAATTTLAARLTRDVMLPMLQEKLALRAERIAREPE